MSNLSVRIFCVALILLMTVTGCASVRYPDRMSPADNTPRTIYWGGVVHSDDPLLAAQRAPIIAELLGKDSFNKGLEARLRSALEAVHTSRPNIEFVTDQTPTHGDGTLLLYFVIVGEHVAVQQINDQRYVSYDLHALAVVANMSKTPQEQRIVASYPVRVQFRDVATTDPDQQQKTETVRKLFLVPDNGMPDIVAEWGKRVMGFRYREKPVWLYIAPLQFEPSASAVLLKADPLNGQNLLKKIALDATLLLEAGVAKQLDIPIVPSDLSSTSHASLCPVTDMAACLTFRVAEPDYGLAVKVNMLGETSATSSGQTGHAYGAQMRVAMLKNPLNEKGEPAKDPEILAQMLLRRMDTLYYHGTRTLPPGTQFSIVIGNFHVDMGDNLCRQDGAWLAQSLAAAETKSLDAVQAEVRRFCRNLIVY